MVPAGKSKQNWQGLMCPVCRFVFRVPINHNGSGVICPACAHLLQIPTFDQRQMVANARDIAMRKPVLSCQDINKHTSYTAVNVPIDKEACHIVEHHADVDEATATDERSQVIDGVEPSQDNIASSEQLLGRVQKDAGSESISPLTWVLSGSLLGVSIVLVSVWLLLQSLDEEKEVVALVNQSAELQSDEILADENPTDSQHAREAQMIRESKKVIVDFLEAKTLSELAGFVRSPNISIPRIKKWYQNDAWVSPGIRSLGYGNSTTISGGVVSMDVQLDDFSVKSISVVNSKSGYKVDWESWVAWSSVKWPNLFDTRPSQAVEVRVHCQRVDYYNSIFSDSNRWFAVRLSHPDFDRVIYGYIDSELPKFYHFITKLVRGEEVSATLIVGFPIDSVVSNQVMILEHVQSGWVRENRPKKQQQNNSH